MDEEDYGYDDEEQVMREMQEMAEAEAEQMAAQMAGSQPPSTATGSGSGRPSQATPATRQPPSAAAPSSAAASGHSFFQNSPALSQISAIREDDDAADCSTAAGPAVNRRLFGTPFHSGAAKAGGSGLGGRIASTPFAGGSGAGGHHHHQPHAMRPLAEVDERQSAESEALASRKRRLEDLFGDIGDIGDDELDRPQLYAPLQSEFESAAKRARTEEEIDMQMIERILEIRRQRQLAEAAAGGGNLGADGRQLQRLEALHRFKEANLSLSLPRWPFTTLRRGDGVAQRERIYVRMHSAEFEAAQIAEVGVQCGRGGGSVAGLLSESREETWRKAQQIINDRLAEADGQAPQPKRPALASPQIAAEVANAGGELWVEKYRPKKYVDLLSDETTNRSLLSWLKMWDKVVFHRDPKPDAAIAKSAQASTGAPAASANALAAVGVNTFNKRTGKFEPFGRYRGLNSNNSQFRRPANQELRTDRDPHGRPQQKCVLLCGPPGLGKTTLAHTIARHAGYAIRELNASDDRSPEAFRLALENGTQMQPLLADSITANAGRGRPNCIILDEIDGAPGPAIEFLCKFLSDAVTTTTASKSRKAGQPAAAPLLLRRPIICICNDLYAPALRPLRQLAFIVHFAPLAANRLAERLAQIARIERMRADMAALLALAAKTGNDVRACLSVLQFQRGLGRPLTVLDVLRSAVGSKDRHRGLFAVWSAIFQIQRPQRTVLEGGDDASAAAAAAAAEPVVSMTDMSQRTRARNVLDALRMAGGDLERLAQGVHENYLGQRQPDSRMHGVCVAADWFCFADRVRQHMQRTQNYALYPYQPYAFVAWHLLFGGLAWPKIGWPAKGAEMARRGAQVEQVAEALRRGCAPAVAAGGCGQGAAMRLDAVPLVRHVLGPQLRPVAVQLLTPKERADLRHTVEVMVDLGLMYVQTKSADGTYQYQLEPNVNMLGTFEVSGGNVPKPVTYTGRQVIAREVELEKMRRIVPKNTEPAAGSAKPKPGGSAKTGGGGGQLPNHLQSLPKPVMPRLTARLAASGLKETVTKDFFGRMSAKQTSITVQEGGTDLIVKSPIWYRYKEGCNNAVRKDVTIASLL